MSPPKPPLGNQDRVLVQAVLARGPGAFEELVGRHQALCWHVINRMVRHPEDTRDLCQETFLRVYRYLHQYRFESSLKTWIAQIAYSVAVRHLKRKRIPLVDSAAGGEVEMLAQADDAFDLEAARADNEMIAALHREIEALAPLQRALLTMYHLEELPISEISAITGLAEGTIKSHLFRSRAKLRQRLRSSREVKR